MKKSGKKIIMYNSNHTIKMAKKLFFKKIVKKRE